MNVPKKYFSSNLKVGQLVFIRTTPIKTNSSSSSFLSYGAGKMLQHCHHYHSHSNPPGSNAIYAKQTNFRKVKNTGNDSEILNVNNHNRTSTSNANMNARTYNVAPKTKYIIMGYKTLKDQAFPKRKSVSFQKEQLSRVEILESKVTENTLQKYEEDEHLGLYGIVVETGSIDRLQVINQYESKFYKVIFGNHEVMHTLWFAAAHLIPIDENGFSSNT